MVRGHRLKEREMPSESQVVRERQPWLALIAAALCFAVAAALRLRRVDWRRVETEQRRWESGPLGRAWLKIRQRLFRL